MIWTNVARKNVAWTNVNMTVGICSRCSQEPIFKVSSKSGQLELRYSWYGQMSQGQMLPGQMSPWQLESVLNVHRNLPLKFHQNRVSNSWDIANIEFLWVVGCAQSLYCQTQPCVEVRLGFWQQDFGTQQVFSKSPSHAFVISEHLALLCFIFRQDNSQTR